jgi:hypothetical protein
VSRCLSYCKYTPVAIITLQGVLQPLSRVLLLGGMYVATAIIEKLRPLTVKWLSVRPRKIHQFAVKRSQATANDHQLSNGVLDSTLTSSLLLTSKISATPPGEMPRLCPCCNSLCAFCRLETKVNRDPMHYQSDCLQLGAQQMKLCGPRTSLFSIKHSQAVQLEILTDLSCCRGTANPGHSLPHHRQPQSSVRCQPNEVKAPGTAEC